MNLFIYYAMNYVKYLCIVFYIYVKFILCPKCNKYGHAWGSINMGCSRALHFSALLELRALHFSAAAGARAVRRAKPGDGCATNYFLACRAFRDC